jgi:hypothetical protein
MIRIDSTPLTIVAVCTACHYRDIDTDRAAVWRRALAHIESVHPDDRRAIAAAGRNTRTRTVGG